MNRLLVLFNFYKLFIASSLIVNSLIVVVNPNYAAALVTKLFLTVLAWYFITETSQKQKLTFYKNLGISPLLLFSFAFIFDSILTVIFIFLFNNLL